MAANLLPPGVPVPPPVPLEGQDYAGQAVVIKQARQYQRDLWEKMPQGKSVGDVLFPKPPSEDLSKSFSDHLVQKHPFYQSFAERYQAKQQALYKAQNKPLPPSKRTHPIGVHFHPFCFEQALAMRELSSHHGSCLDTIVDLAIGQGFVDEKIEKTLDKLTETGFLLVLKEMCKHLAATGHGYIEAVREPGKAVDGEIQALYPQPAKDMLIVQHGPSILDRHYLFSPLADGFGYGHDFVWDHMKSESQAVFAKFGKVDELLQVNDLVAAGASMSFTDRVVTPSDVGEVIAFKIPTEMWQVYGGPWWIGANSYLELGRCHLGRTHLYMQNRGAPDSILFMYGVHLSDEQEKALSTTLNAGQGDGYGKSVALTFPNVSQQTGKAHVERFGDQIDGSTFMEIHDTVALAVCSAHRVPPVLAGISTGRSLGATAEMTQALVITQMNVITPFQNLISKILECTLGGERGVPALKGNKFELKKVTEEADMAALNVMARSKQQDSSLTRGTEKKDGATPTLKR